jgi:hypothetical protein
MNAVNFSAKGKRINEQTADVLALSLVQTPQKACVLASGPQVARKPQWPDVLRALPHRRINSSAAL